jgi:ADP-heptose:LPS heptosyltransferase
MSWELDGRPLRRILVTRLRYLGDIAMSTVVLAALRRGDPDLELGYVCEEDFAALLTAHPDLQRLHLLRAVRRGADARARARTEPTTAAAADVLGTAVALRRARYDLAVDLFFNPRSAWLLRLSGIPRRIGGTTRSRRRLYTHVAVAPPSGAGQDFARVAPGGLGDHLARLAPLRHRPSGLSFLAWLGEAFAPGELRPCVNAPTAAGTPMAPLLSSLGAVAGRYTLLAPAATWPTKEWPATHWRDLARRLIATGEAPVVVLCPPGGPQAHGELAAEIPAGRGGLLPPLPLADALRVVAGAGRLVSADGGIMHAAVAMGVPTVALFGPTDPAVWFPYEGLGAFRVLATRPPCAPCHLHDCGAFVCLPDLHPDVVVAAAAALPTLSAAPSRDVAP